MFTRINENDLTAISINQKQILEFIETLEKNIKDLENQKQILENIYQRWEFEVAVFTDEDHSVE
jgi:hypothetical protein